MNIPDMVFMTYTLGVLVTWGMLAGLTMWAHLFSHWQLSPLRSFDMETFMAGMMIGVAWPICVMILTGVGFVKWWKWTFLFQPQLVLQKIEEDE